MSTETSENPCPFDRSIDLFIEVATLAGKLGEAINAALDLRSDMLAGNAISEQREWHLAEHFQDISEQSQLLAQRLRAKHVGISIPDDEEDQDVSRRSEGKAETPHSSHQSHTSHLCLEHLEYLRTETTVVPGLDNPPRAHFRCKICGQHLSRGGFAPPSEISDPESEILANPS